MAIERTENFKLAIVPEDDTTTTFKEWRVALDGTDASSNMQIIDKELKDHTHAAYQVSYDCGVEDAAINNELCDVDAVLNELVKRSQGNVNNPKMITETALNTTWTPGWYLCEFDPWNEQNNGMDRFLVQVVQVCDFDDCLQVYQIAQDESGHRIYRNTISSTDEYPVTPAEFFTQFPFGSWTEVHDHGTLPHPWRVTVEELENTWEPGWYMCRMSPCTDGEEYDLSGDLLVKVVNQYDDSDGTYNVAQVIFTMGGNPYAYRLAYSDIAQNYSQVIETSNNKSDKSGFGDWTRAAFVPLSHANKEVKYGKGTNNLYGHVKLSDDPDNNSKAADGGTAVTPYALQNHRDEEGNATTFGHLKLTDEPSKDLNSGSATALAPIALHEHQNGIADADHYGHVHVLDTVASGFEEIEGMVPSVAAVRSAILGATTRAATVVIGTSQSHHDKFDCDYLCDGTDDQEQINQAITSLGSAGINGGTVLLLNGVYHITAEINMNKPNVTLAGVDRDATIIKRQFVTTSATSVMIHGAANYCTIRDLTVDGNGTQYNNSDGYAQDNIKIEASCTNWTIDNIISKDANIGGSECQGSGLIVPHPSGSTTPGDTCHKIINSAFTNNSDCGMYIYGNFNTISNNIYDNNGEMGLWVTCDLTKCGGNMITGNRCNKNDCQGIYITGDQNTLANNICNDNGEDGILIADIKSHGNIVTGNICSNNGGSGLKIDGGDAVIAGNMVNENEEIGIFLDWGGSNSVVGNVMNYGNSVADIKISSRGMCNFIAGNFLKGIVIDEGTSNMNQKFGNMCGTSVANM